MAVLHFLFSIFWALRQAVQVIRYFFPPDYEDNKKSKFNKQVLIYPISMLRIIFSLHLLERPIQVFFKHAVLFTSLFPLLFFLSLKIKWWAIKAGCYIWCIQTSQVDSIMILITTLSVTRWQVDTSGLCPAILFSPILLLHSTNSNMIRVNVTKFCLLLIQIWYMDVVHIFVRFSR